MSKTYETNPQPSFGVPFFLPIGEVHEKPEPITRPEPPKREVG